MRRSSALAPGFGMAEILVSVGILVPVITVAVGIFPFGWLVNRQAAGVLFARDVARSQLEAARAAAFDTLPAHTDGSAADARGNRYICSVDVAPAVAGMPVSLKRVSVVVSWTDRVPQRLEIATLLARTAHR